MKHEKLVSNELMRVDQKLVSNELMRVELPPKDDEAQQVSSFLKNKGSFHPKSHQDLMM